MATDNFFESSKTASQVKSDIVKKYFWAWAKIIGQRANNIAYVDLYAGKGMYDDGTKSTPLLVLENALRDDMMKEKLVAIFNDVNKKYTESLQQAINSIPNIDELKNKPKVLNYQVGKDIVGTIKSLSQIPTLLFIDPWGYKGLTLDLIKASLKDWGCDCIFFFNYNRINAGIDNSKFNCHIEAIFGKQRAEKLRKATSNQRAHIREKIIIEALNDALKEARGEFVVPFKFYREDCRKTSHFIIFVTKNVLGYDIMKQIMADESSYKYQDVATFEYDPHPDRNRYCLFPPEPLLELENDLIRVFKSQTFTVQEIYYKHNVGTKYIKANYKEVLLKLEAESKILTDPSSNKRQKRGGKHTISDTVKVTFQ